MLHSCYKLNKGLLASKIIAYHSKETFINRGVNNKLMMAKPSDFPRYVWSGRLLTSERSNNILVPPGRVAVTTDYFSPPHW